MQLDRCYGVLLVVVAVLVPAEGATTSGDALAHNVFERYFNWRLQDNPWFASQVRVAAATPSRPAERASERTRERVGWSECSA